MELSAEQEKIMKIREQQRINQRKNYQKRKEEGRLKSYYEKKINKVERIKPPPTLDELKKLKYIKKPTTIRISYEEYEKFRQQREQDILNLSNDEEHKVQEEPEQDINHIFL